MGAFSAFFKARVEEEAAAHADANDDSSLEAAFKAPELVRVTRRVRQLVDNDVETLFRLAASSAAHPDVAYSQLEEAWAAGHLAEPGHPAVRHLQATVDAHAPSAEDGNDRNSTVRMLRESLHRDLSSALQTVASNRRVLPFRSLNGQPAERHLQTARRLGIFTLIDLQLGKGLKFDRYFGITKFGVRVTFINRNLVRIRASLFDGIFRLEVFNQLLLAARVFSVNVSIMLHC